MRTRRRTLLLAAVGAALAGCSGGDPDSGGAPTPGPSAFDPSAYRPPDVPPDQLAAMFAYDAAGSAATPAGPPRDDGGVRVTEVRYAGVTAILAEPVAARGRVPGVVFAAGSGVPGDVWLPEARELVKLGAVALLPTHPMNLSGDATRDAAHLRDTAIAQRRGLDVLAAHPAVDAARLGFVGHSWGGVHALILSGIEARLTAVAAVAAGGRFSRFAYRQYRPADGRAYLDAMSRFDGVRYASMAARRRMLLQFGRRDPIFDRAETDELAAAASGTVERRDYDAGHDLVAEAAAGADRLAFLRRVLG